MDEFKHIKNIIFDLGAVIIPIDFEKTFCAFSNLSGIPVDEIKTRYLNATLFVDFETGLIGNFAFLQGLRLLLNMDQTISDHELRNAWNALLLDIPEERINRILELTDTYRIFILSNTNPIHIKAVNQILYDFTGSPTLEEVVEHAFYSYDMGMIKPDPNIYTTALAQFGLIADETFFLDDNADNIAGAQSVGIHTALVTEQHSLFEILKHA
ncbi:HAD family phosphatase [uncultured Cytophaga sp.]|uniref:HAD family hydrolase n=1 Tax=uncultured Cytophaga sp. TaxID=160238 RepID=UPI00263219B1|nr:HAD family phosphatase [uncultured Cytophaga sp.]